MLVDMHRQSEPLPQLLLYYSMHQTIIHATSYLRKILRKLYQLHN